MHEEISLVRLANECKLSLSHFARAFKQSAGQPTHRWLLQQRLDKAKELLLNSSLPLADIALACGFSEQSHFTRVFNKKVGTTPGAWRRALRKW